MIDKELIGTAVMLAKPLEYLDLDIRTFNALKRRGINRIYEVYLVGNDIMKIRNFGPKSLCDLQMCLRLKNLPEFEVKE